MDVTCERCGTEYEFDETLLSDRGTSVKCTNCGHVFKVYPPATANDDPGSSSWRLRMSDGSVDAIDSLRELQRRIAAGELTPDDEIARGNEDWKTLRSIPELETFFRAAGVEIESNRIPSPLPPVMPPPERPDSTLPPGKRPRQPTLLGVSPVRPMPGPVGAEAPAPAPTRSTNEPKTTAGLGPDLVPGLGVEPVDTSEPMVPGPSAPEASSSLGSRAKPRNEPKTTLGLGPAAPLEAEAEAATGSEAAAEAVAATEAEAATATEAAAGAASEAEAATEAGSVAASGTEAASAAVSAAGAASGTESEAATGSVPASEMGAVVSFEEVHGAADTQEVAYESPYTRDSLAGTAPAPVEDAEFEEKPRRAPRPSTPPPAYYDDDDDIPELSGRGSSPLRWLLVVLVVGGAALVATQWERVAGLLGIGSDPAQIAAGIAEGDASVAEGHPAAYADAIEAYGRAAGAGGDRDVELLTKLSNAYALAAQAQLDAGESGERVEDLVSAAQSTAEAAGELNPRSVEAQLANADAVRLAGDTTGARDRLEDVRAISFSRTAEFYRVDARLNADQADGRLENALRSARQAVELAPTGVPYLLLLARAEHAANHADRARDALNQVLADHPEHPVATGLLAAWSAETDGETETAAETEAASATGTAAETEPASATGTEAGAGTASPAETAAEKAEPVKAEAPKPEPVKAKPAKPVPDARAKAPAKTKMAKTEAAKAPPAKKAAERKPARKAPEYDEYDRLAQAASQDAFIDGRPPVLDYESNMAKGRAELAAGNHARARAYFDSALEVHPGSAEAMDALGDVATAVSDFASALRYYRVAAQRGHPSGYYKLGQTYERLGQNDKAVSAYYTYVKRRPEGKHASAARSAIKTLEPRAVLPPEPGAEPEPESAAPPSTKPEPPAAEDTPPAADDAPDQSEPDTP